MISGLAARPLEQQGGEVVVEVERRVLAHEHGVAAAQRDRRLRPEQVVVARDPAHGGRPGARHGVGVLEREVARLAEPDLVAAGLRGQHDGEGRVAGDLQTRQRVHHEQKLHAFIVAASGPAVPAGSSAAAGGARRRGGAAAVVSFMGRRCSRPCLRIR